MTTSNREEMSKRLHDALIDALTPLLGDQPGQVLGIEIKIALCTGPGLVTGQTLEVYEAPWVAHLMAQPEFWEITTTKTRIVPKKRARN